ncbi:MAG TPA: GNAT family N-acetyltransferase [Thermodesulfobacteriota bacterium]|nr:GNAT family N-acetyltransferase [Thermodesulfobacteriota bacterium]
MDFANFKHNEMIIYPREIILKDKTTIILRPLEEDDKEGLLDFFSKIPRSDLIIFKDDVGKLETVESWFTSSKYDKVFQLIALRGKKIIGKGTLHKEGLYWRFSTEIKLIVEPEHRGRGLGLQMFKMLLAEGLNQNFEKVVVRFTNDNKSFIRILDHFGFKPEAVLTCYIKDEQTEIKKDLLIASYNLKDWARRFEFYNIIYGGK